MQPSYSHDDGNAHKLDQTFIDRYESWATTGISHPEYARYASMRTLSDAQFVHCVITLLNKTQHNETTFGENQPPGPKIRTTYTF